MDKDSEAYKSGDYEEFFKAAESEDLVMEDVVAYSDSLQKLRDTERGIRYAARTDF